MSKEAAKKEYRKAQKQAEFDYQTAEKTLHFNARDESDT